MDNTIYEPLKNYEEIYKAKVNEEAHKYFDDLIKEAKVNEEENDRLVKEYNKVLENKTKAEKKLGTYKGFRIFLYVVLIISIILGIFFLIKHSSTLLIVFGVILLLLSVGIIVYLFKRINPIIKHHTEIVDAINQQVIKAYDACYASVSPLYTKFDFNMASKVIEKAVPMIQLDDYFKVEKLFDLKNKFGYTPLNKDNATTILVQSGDLNDNPFMLVRERIQDMTMQTYTGTRVISWTESYTDSDGNSRTRTRTQTLIATVTKPMPVYHSDTYLVYGNEAGSNLSFNRTPTYNKDIGDEKDIDKFVRRREDNLENYAEKQTKKGKSFTALTNTEFEILFNALDRNNEVEFRLLFSPLAQNNEVDLITKNKYFGDDFTFIKNGPINYIKSKHMQNFQLNQDTIIKSHCLKDVRNNFINYVNEYFLNLYFDLAPLLAIPLYQQHKSTGAIYDSSYRFNFTSLEEEVMANSFDVNLLRSKDGFTENICKINEVKKVGKSDFVNVIAHSFTKNTLMELVPTLGGDGRFHNVPVYYDVYLPVSKNSNIVVKEFFTDKQDAQEVIHDVREYLRKLNVSDVIYKCGLISFICDEFSEENDKELTKIISCKKGGN